MSLQYRDWVWRGWQTRYAFCRAEIQQNLPPILLIHGFGAAIGHWRDNVPEFAKRHTVYAIDLVGFGASQKPPTEYAIALWVAQIFDFWQTFVREPMVLVGNSIGSLMAVIAAHRHPEMARGAIAISLPDMAALEAMLPKPVRPIKRSLEALVAGLLAKPAFYIIRQPQVIRSVLRQGIYISDRSRVDDALVEIIAKPARERHAAEAFLRLSRSINRPGYSPSLTTALSELQIPILLLWGTQDKAIPPAEGSRLVKYARFAQLVQLEGMGHCPHDENPARVNQEILMWIDREVLTSDHVA